MSKRPTVLMILDGYGLNNNQKGNAVAEDINSSFIRSTL